jgi:hypothetical protein
LGQFGTKSNQICFASKKKKDRHHHHRGKVMMMGNAVACA